MDLKTDRNAGLLPRANGTPPPEVPLSDVDLGSLEFWGRDDDFRDGAFATLRREARSRSGRRSNCRDSPAAPDIGH
ncbi:putative cytochrome P450 domain protein [Mycobacterium kansasii]|uniref:Putative cytochrome P450 domain protein n=1 Tax=Mycobacterium kansasii TaxID=1768 RepID=A0A1V3WMB8_MYCKA|nr:putative cytochrome P450 domain protein [Mycobacterium kansasii]